MTRQNSWIQLADLCLIELSNWRWTWRSTVTVSMILPLTGMIALAFYGRESGQAALGAIFSGSLVMSLMFGNLRNIQAHIIFMRMEGTLEYFATLPIHKNGLLLAIILAFFALSLPSLLATLLIGSAILDLPLSIHPLALLVIPLCVAPMSAIGALIGVYAREPQQGNSLSLLVTFAFAGLGAVIVPAEQLPAALQRIGMFNPAALAASALRQTLLGPVTDGLALDLLLLCAFALLILSLVSRKLDWRER